MEVNAGTWDSQADIFNFNVGGKSGKFMFGKNQDFLMLTPNKIKVTKEIFEDGLNTIINSFTILDEAGTKYEFDAKETTSVGLTAFDRYISSWYLTKIVSPFSTDSILFEYETEFYGYGTGKNGTQTLMLDLNVQNPPISGGISGVVITGKELSKSICQIILH